jgi:NAD(P)-dependent dehydrogenase (short-subunit alcohol dehydrogenase family)
MTRDRAVLVTGANSGIGLATVLELARHGLRPIGTVRSEAKARRVADVAAGARVRVETVIADVTDASSCADVVEHIRPWALVNNAGYSATGAVEDVGDEEVHRALETMVVAPMRLARLALPHMREAGSGRIVNLSSIYGIATTPLTGWYQSCKHALEAVSDALRNEVASAGVKVVLVEPGGFRTGIWEEATGELEGRTSSRYGSAYQRAILGTRLAQPAMGDPSQVARVVRRALTTRCPRSRYLVGYDAQVAAVVQRAVPTPIRDRVTRLVLGL